VSRVLLASFGIGLLTLISWPLFGVFGRESTGNPENKCLDCHGPFEQLAAAEPSFAVSADKKINPHRYVPHDSKSLPDCTPCHEVHPVPPTEPVKKPTSVGWCYSCHHTQDFFINCKECH
jgi:hypothetical protein